MACQPNAEQTTRCGCGNGYVIIIVLYILLAIILGAWVAF